MWHLIGEVTLHYLYFNALHKNYLILNVSKREFGVGSSLQMSAILDYGSLDPLWNRI